jgi:hypothetical protein
MFVPPDTSRIEQANYITKWLIYMLINYLPGAGLKVNSFSAAPRLFQQTDTISPEESGLMAT